MAGTLEARSAIYRLKRQYGELVDFYRISDEIVDPQTGDRTRDVTLLLRVRKCIPFSYVHDRFFIQDIAYLRAASNFTEGGLLDRKIERFLIDKRDLNDTDFTLDDFCRWDNERWEVKGVEKLKLDVGVIITAMAVSGSPHRFAYNAVASESLTLTDEGVYLIV